MGFKGVPQKYHFFIYYLKIYFRQITTGDVFETASRIFKNYSPDLHLDSRSNIKKMFMSDNLNNLFCIRIHIVKNL